MRKEKECSSRLGGLGYSFRKVWDCIEMLGTRRELHRQVFRLRSAGPAA